EWVRKDLGLPVRKLGDISDDHEGHPNLLKNEITLFIDVNGDGLVDAIQSDHGIPRTYKNNGVDFSWRPATLSVPTPPTGYDVDKFFAVAQPIDINSDGNTDLLLPVQDGPSSASWYVLESSTTGDGSFNPRPLGIPFRSSIHNGVVIELDKDS